MNTRERFVRTLTGQEVDRVPFMKVFGVTAATLPTWVEKYPSLPEYIDELLQFEGGYRGWRITPVNFWLCGTPAETVLSETDRELVLRLGDGTVTRRLKHGDYHAHTLEYPVKTREDWDRIKSCWLDPDDPRRFPKDWCNYVDLYRNREFPLQLTCGGVYGFLRKMLGDEALCYAFYDDPELVHDITGTYVTMLLRLWERMCADVEFDLIESWEDMASKTGSIVGPGTFEEFLAPQFRRIRAFADAHRIPIVLVDSDGNIDRLATWMYGAGVNAMYPFEVGAGCDIEGTLDALPGMGGIGGLEKDACAHGKAAIDAQLERARRLIRHGRIIPGPDHFVLENVPFEGYRDFMRGLRNVILTTKPGY
ncbi:MAG: hypothetical protein ACOXZM_09510 [Eubacteriales bacterium]|jgi:hypothetical protein